ncbi:hypothetical protein, partial [Microbulbifer sp. TYP-18]|uniref:hypothetical protein n=1 Tax=Microbulbifer sp. TYP-18 TaxID=3230024 RepID=UPI0034C6D7AD
MAVTMTFVEDSATHQVYLAGSGSFQGQPAETVTAQQVASRALEVTLDAKGQPIAVEITGDVGVVARLAAQVVEAEQNAGASAAAAA